MKWAHYHHILPPQPGSPHYSHHCRLTLVADQVPNTVQRRSHCLQGFDHARLDWIEQGLTSYSTHFGPFWRWWGDCGISQDCSRSQTKQCVRCWVVCARPLLTIVVCMCIIWKALCLYMHEPELSDWHHQVPCFVTSCNRNLWQIQILTAPTSSSLITRFLKPP